MAKIIVIWMAPLKRDLWIGLTWLMLMSPAYAMVSEAGNGAETCPKSDLLLHNGVVYSIDEQNSQHQAVASKDGLISFIGSDEDAEKIFCGATKVIDLKGAFVFPGFTDSHQHLEGIGRRTKTLSLFGINTLKKTVTNIEHWASGIPEGEWVLGRGWIEREWTDERRFLTRWDVDSFTESKPLFMPRADGVSALVNTKALTLGGITHETADPIGGRFERDEEGILTGYVLGTAMDRFKELIPRDTDTYMKDNLYSGRRANAAMGWTATHDAGMTWRELRLLKELADDGLMSHRVYVAVPITEAEPLMAMGPEQSEDGWLELRGVKVFIDGTLGSRGAALLEPYQDADHKGFMNRTTKKQLMPILEAALKNGIQVMTHVIGDRALRSTLNWYQEAMDALPKDKWATADLRWRLEHAQIIPLSDQQRIADMKLIVSMQPSHAIGDLNFAPARLGKARLQYAYPWRQLIEKNIPVIAGSDAPVEVGDPRIEFYAAITRKRLDGSFGEGWHLEHAVSRLSALRMLTIKPAYAAFKEQVRGTLEVGKQADLSIFDTDFMTAKPSEILEAHTVMTVVDGRDVFKADDFF